MSIQQKLFGTMCTIINAGGPDPQPQGTQNTDNGAHGSEKLPLNTQISDDFA